MSTNERARKQVYLFPGSFVCAHIGASLPIGARLCPDCTIIEQQECGAKPGIAPNRGTTVPRLSDQASAKCVVRSRASLPIGARLCPDCPIKRAPSAWCEAGHRSQSGHGCAPIARSSSNKSVERSRASLPIHSRPDGRRHRLSGPAALSSCSN